MSRPSREEAIARLNRLYDQLEADENLPAGDRLAFAGVHVRTALNFAAGVCGPEVMGEAYGPNPDAEDRPACLATLSDRLWVAYHFFSSFEDPQSGSSIAEAAQDAYLVANGDDPKLFAVTAKHKGRKGGAFALDHHKLAALKWDAYLKGFGLKASDRQGIVTMAYGVTWQAVEKWGRVLKDTFGDGTVQSELAVSHLQGSQSARIGHVAPLDEINAAGTSFKLAKASLSGDNVQPRRGCIVQVVPSVSVASE